MVLVPKKQDRQPAHHRKRQAMHHRRSKRYDKTYWPYLPLIAVVGLGFVINMLWTPVLRHLSGSSVLSYATETSIGALLDATNQQRSANSESGLSINALLNAAAQTKAQDMADRDYWSHVTPDGAEPWQFIQNAGYSYSLAGENLAYGFDSSSGTITGWMNSPGHRANILKAEYQDVGFGIAQAANYQGNGPETIVVAMYGAPAAATRSVRAVTPASPSPAVAATPPSASVQPSAPSTAPATTPVTTSDIPTIAAQSDKAEINQTAIVPASDTNARPITPATTVSSQPVSRLQALSPGMPAGVFLMAIAIIASGAGILIGRHLRYWHRIVVKGERYVLLHPALDITIISLITIGVLLTRTAGIIH